MIVVKRDPDKSRKTTHSERKQPARENDVSSPGSPIHPHDMQIEHDAADVVPRSFHMTAP